jgi:hypothetical protein
VTSPVRRETACCRMARHQWRHRERWTSAGFALGNGCASDGKTTPFAARDALGFSVLVRTWWFV